MQVVVFDVQRMILPGYIANPDNDICPIGVRSSDYIFKLLIRCIHLQIQNECGGVSVASLPYMRWFNICRTHCI